MPKTNKNYWKPKLERNIQKQKENIKLLKKDGWKVNILWECELKSNELVSKKVSQILS